MLLDTHPLLTTLRAHSKASRLTFDAGPHPIAALPQQAVDAEMFTAAEMRAILEQLYGVSLASLETLVPVPRALALRTPDACRERVLLPYAIDDWVLRVVMADPWDFDTIAALEMETGLRVAPEVALKSEIESAIRRVYESTEQLSQAIGALISDAGATADAQIDVADLEDPNAPVVRLVRYLLQQGMALGASDIHLEPYPNHSSLRYRIDGVLQAYDGPPRTLHDAVIARIKVLSNLDVTETRIPQDGRLTFRQGDRAAEFRVSTMPFAAGEGVVLRILDKSNLVLDIRKLGFPTEELDLFEKAVASPNGIILVSGPTGSGKSTTLYAALKDIATSDRKVITVEDPVEYKMVGVCQSTVRPDIGYTFATGLRSILRHDPDVVMIGEMRDQESAEIAVRAALTGHLVLSTIHTNDALSVVTRLLDMGVASYLVTATLRLALAQRLVRRLCTACRVAVTVSRTDIEAVMFNARLRATLPEQVTVYRASGCAACRDLGFRGRTAVYEVLDTRALFSEMRDRSLSPSEMREAALRVGLRTLRTSGVAKVLEGETSLEEIVKITEDF